MGKILGKFLEDRIEELNLILKKMSDRDPRRTLTEKTLETNKTFLVYVNPRSHIFSNIKKVLH